MKRFSLLFVSLLLMGLGMSVSVSAKPRPKDYVGQWNMIVESSMGEMVYHISIVKAKGNTLTGEMWSDGYPEHVSLKDVEATDDGLDFKMSTYGRDVPLSFKKNADGSISGVMPGNAFMKESKITLVRTGK